MAPALRRARRESQLTRLDSRGSMRTGSAAPFRRESQLLVRNRADGRVEAAPGLPGKSLCMGWCRGIAEHAVHGMLSGESGAAKG